MGWTMLDDAFDSHAKVLMLGTGMRGDARRWTWTRILIYTNRYKSAEIPQHIGASIAGATRAFLRDCVELGLAEMDAEGRLVVHDWPIYADLPLGAKVGYCLQRSPFATANDIAKLLPHNRQKVLVEVKKQRPNGFKEPPDWDDEPLVPWNHPGTDQGGSNPGSLSPSPAPKSETHLPPSTVQTGGSDHAYAGKHRIERLLLAVGLPNDPEAATKIERAARDMPEAAIVEAIEACSGTKVRDRLAVALSTLKKRRNAA